MHAWSAIRDLQHERGVVEWLIKHEAKETVHVSVFCPHWLVVVGPTTTQPLLTTTQASFAQLSEHKKF